MNYKDFIILAVKIFLEVILPIVDVISDVYFTWDVYNRGEIKYFTTSGIFLKENAVLGDQYPPSPPIFFIK